MQPARWGRQLLQAEGPPRKVLIAAGWRGRMRGERSP
jgi:hypothetical protein